MELCKLLNCSICGHEGVYVYGKVGSILNTSCPSCGVSSQPMIDHRQRQIDAEKTPKEPEVIQARRSYRRPQVPPQT